MTTAFSTGIVVHALPLFVHLGVGAAERTPLQEVHVECRVQFSVPPAALHTDHISDTLCYAALVAALRSRVDAAQFHLLEHLAWALYEHALPLVPEGAMLELHVTKLHPPIEGGSGPISFYIRSE